MNQKAMNASVQNLRNAKTQKIFFLKYKKFYKIYIQTHDNQSLGLLKPPDSSSAIVILT